MGKVFSFEQHQTAMLIGKAQDISREKGYTPAETLSACVVCGITYNGRRDLSILDLPDVTREQLVNCAPVLDQSFFTEARRMQQDLAYRQKWLERYQMEIQPEVEQTS